MEDTPSTCRLYIGNLSYNIREDDIKEMFSTVGAVKDVYLPRIYKTKKHKGYGFVEMESEDIASKAIQELHGQPDLYDRAMVVRLADVRRSKEEIISSKKRNKPNFSHA